MSFVSDFSLFPIKKLGQPGWSYSKATWPMIIDPMVHDLLDGQTEDDITYDRKRIRDGKMQHCTVTLEDDKLILKPGDGFNYLVRRDSKINKI